MVFRPQLQLIATAPATEGKGMVVECRSYRAKLELFNSGAGEVFIDQVEQQGGQQRPMNHQCRV